MARVAVPLTDRRIRQTAPAAKPVKLADGGGMYLLLRPDGSRYWRLDYRFDGKRKTLALGVYPDVGIADARQRRDSAKAMLAAGQDPGAVRKAQKAGSLHEVTERKRGELHMRQRNLLLQTIAEVNEMLLADLPEPELMSCICQELVRDGLFRMAWIGLVAEDGATVRPVAEAGFEAGYLAQANIRCDESPQGLGPTGMAIRLGSTIINNDTETNQQFAPWRELARVHGIRSSAATPLRVNGRIIGALNVYSAEAHAFGPEKVVLLEKLAADLGMAKDHRAALAALRENEERFRLISSMATDLLFSCAKTAEGSLVVDWATASAGRVFGYSVDEILERGCWRCYVHPDDHPEFDRNITDLAPGQRSESDLRIIAKDGSTRHIRAYTRAVEAENGQLRLYGACQDITDHKRAEEALRESEARFRAMAEHSADWIWAIDTRGRHTYSNLKGASVLGYAMEEFLAQDAASLVHPDDLPRFQETLSNAMATRSGWRGVSLRWRHRDGSYRTLESSASPLFNEAGQLIGFQGVDRDITERKMAEEHIEYLAHHDALTGLPNRVLLRDRFAHALAMAERSHSHVALLFLDLDKFKRVNDTLGHAAGDKLLLEVVTRLGHCTRETDTISRQGGDEFILLLNDIPDSEAVERIAGEILARVGEPVEINGHMLNTSCSIGIAMYPEDGDDFDGLLQKADVAMYNAKDAGRNTWRFFNDQMNLQAREHLLLQNRLHQAMSRSEFRLDYQPQLEIGSGRVVGVEALLRWHNHELGNVVPARFIPVAEDSGLIVPIGAWVLWQACHQAQTWRNAGLPEMTISVNLSALQFRRASLIETVAGALAHSGLPPHLLELELTESILLQDVENTLETVRQLKATGVKLSIDDFGTGYSSLSYLKRFAVDRLKIDRTFVRDINTDPDDAAIVRAIIQLARSLRLDIIAEGVETPEQLAFLREAGCQEVQGHLFSRPLQAAALEAYLRGR